jgi:hypothetical protein
VSKPTEEELAPLEKEKNGGNDEGYHWEYDKMLEAKLRQLDPEWMAAVDAYDDASNMCHWFA